MNKKAIKDMFSINLENSDINENEINDLLEIGNALSNKDFSKDSNKEAVYARTLKNINNHKGDINMKQSNRIKATIAASVASALVLGGSFSQTAFGKELVYKIIDTFSLDHIKVIQTETVKKESKPIPEHLKGKFFDENGKEVTAFDKDYKGKYYTADGKEISGVSVMGSDMSKAEIVTKEDRLDSILAVKDTSKLNDYTCFNVKLPSYLPEGYEFDRAEFYKDDNGKVEKTKYISLYFTNKEGKELYMQQRFADKETAYETGTDGTVEKIKINGADAILSDNTELDFEANTTLYGISTKGNISKNELIKMAESIK